MMSKATRKLVLKKELLRTLDEGHLRAVNGGKISFDFVALGDERPSRECTYRQIIVPEPELVAPEAASLADWP